MAKRWSCRCCDDNGMDLTLILLKPKLETDPSEVYICIILYLMIFSINKKHNSIQVTIDMRVAHGSCMIKRLKLQTQCASCLYSLECGEQKWIIRWACTL